MTERADGSDVEPDPSPRVELVEGTTRIADLDEFLDEIGTIGEETAAVVQAFDADLVVSADQLRLATRLAARSIARDEAVARDPAVEILLYAAGDRQIERALELGVSEGDARIVAVVADFGAVSGLDRPVADLDAAVGSLEALVDPAETLGTFDETAVRAFYGVTDRELAATVGDVTDAVRERVALLDVEK
ncbi:KEOPS complex subunit Cgi121 [Halorubrum luteum]